MLQNLTGWHALIILAVVVLLFGAAKLPALARSIGQSVRILKNETAAEAGTVPAAPTDVAAAEPKTLSSAPAAPTAPVPARAMPERAS
ncbi:twin-arginine translocase TatA/TatE family subunit [Microbacterium sp. B24]|uniref:twin-arginine translocase TatA/TatE family subunit n=1 Tax=Microbacterium sp. B24 TaxID=95616 RepID=UPI00040791BB|nr:twin-arginine translocase TatA/TatE family subunit [Microbacterium sp. B24]